MIFFQYTIGIGGSEVVVGESAVGAVLGQMVAIAAAVLVLLGILLWAVRYALHHILREKLGFGKVVYLLQVPKESSEKKGEMDKERTLEEMREDISISESFFAAVGGLKAEHGLASWFLGRKDAFAFEIVSLHGLISYYVAAPKKYANLLVQQIHAHYPNAHIEETEDYNLFSPQGAIVGGYLKEKRHHLFPIKTYRKIETDPVESLNASLSRIPAGEGAAVQYIVRSAHKSWRSKGAKVALEMQKGKSVSTAVKATTLWGGLQKFFPTKKKKDEPSSAPRSLSPLEQETQKGIQEKASKAGLDVTVRVLASAPTDERAHQVFNDLCNVFAQYNMYEYGNTWSKVVPSSKNHLIRDFIFRSFEDTKATVLSADEVASLFHPPLPRDSTPNIRWLGARSAPPPVNMPAEGLEIGLSVYRGEEIRVRMKTDDRMRHVYIIGRSGVGKSTLMEHMIDQDIRAGRGVCVVDPHGELVEAVLSRVPRERAEDVMIFDPSDTDRPVGLNMLEADTPEAVDFATQEMIAIFYKLVSDPQMIGPMFEHYMRNAMITLMSNHDEPGTLVEIPRILTDTDFQKEKLKTVTDPIIRAFWEKELPQTSGQTKGEMLPYLVSKIGRFIENVMVRNIVGQQRSGFDFREVMDKKKILLVNLSKGKVGEMNAKLLGLICVTKLQMAALARADVAQSERSDFFLYIDEFQNFITDSIGTILSEARKYRLALIMAHQYMGQLEQKEGDTKVRDAILGNVGTMIVFRIGIEDAEALEKEFAPTFSAYDLINIEKYTAYTKLLIDNTASKPFNMRTIAPPKGDPKMVAAIKQLSRLTFGRDKALVEEEIIERSQLGGGDAGEDEDEEDPFKMPKL